MVDFMLSSSVAFYVYTTLYFVASTRWLFMFPKLSTTMVGTICCFTNDVRSMTYKSWNGGADFELIYTLIISYVVLGQNIFCLICLLKCVLDILFVKVYICF